MRFKVRKLDAKTRALRMWHVWFAWYPVRVPTKGRMSGQTIVWLAGVERQKKTHFSMRVHWVTRVYRFKE